jgi:hypothetical protein
MVIRKGGLVSDITVGDCLELTAALEEHHFRGSAGRPLFYALLKDAGVLPAAAPSRLRALRIEGRRSVAQIVDGYGIECRPVRDLLVEYFSERAPELDHTSLRSIARNLCRLFWRDLEIHHPGIDSLQLTPQVAQAWKERLAHIRDADGQPVRPRINYRSELVFVLSCPAFSGLANLRLSYAVAFIFRHSSMTSCGVLYPSAEWRRFRL